MAAPVLLGLTLALNRLTPTSAVPRRDLVMLKLMLPAAAIFVTINSPRLIWTGWDYPRLRLSPLLLATAGAFLIYTHVFLRRYAARTLAAGALVLAGYALGPSPSQMIRSAEDMWAWAVRTGDRLLPKTAADWGLVGLTASFGFLGIGFWVSLRKAARRESAG